jgi:hypothetical protein
MRVGVYVDGYNLLPNLDLVLLTRSLVGRVFSSQRSPRVETNADNYDAL